MPLRWQHFFEGRHSDVEIRWFNLNPDAIPAQDSCGCAGRASSHEWIKDCIFYEREHTTESFGELPGIGCRVSRGRCTTECPYLLEILAMQVLGDNGHYSSSEGRLPITSWLSLEQDELDVVLDDRVRLVRLS